jgi:hypothetical protein
MAVRASALRRELGMKTWIRERYLGPSDVTLQRVDTQATTRRPSTGERACVIAERGATGAAVRKLERLLSGRKRRVLAQWLRRTANRTPDPRRDHRRGALLLLERGAAGRTDCTRSHRFLSTPTNLIQRT